MVRTELINRLAQLIQAESYLEIGISCGSNFSAINCRKKLGVDPDVNAVSATRHQTSDEFFADNTESFDLIFIDGLHHSEQVQRDIEHALERLNPEGCIVCHDMNPLSEIMQKVPPESPEWTGDCWKAWVTIRTQRSDLNMFVVDTDYGCGIIRRGTQALLNTYGRPLDWPNLCQNRKDWLNLFTVADFKSWLSTQKQILPAMRLHTQQNAISDDAPILSEPEGRLNS